MFEKFGMDYEHIFHLVTMFLVQEQNVTSGLCVNHHWVPTGRGGKIKKEKESKKALYLLNKQIRKFAHGQLG